MQDLKRSSRRRPSWGVGGEDAAGCGRTREALSHLSEHPLQPPRSWVTLILTFSLLTPLGRTTRPAPQGQATDIAIQAEEIMKLKKQLYSIYAKHTKQSLQVIGECKPPAALFCCARHAHT